MTTTTLSRPLLDRICDALTTNPYVPSQDVRIEAADGHVVLQGNVKHVLPEADGPGSGSPD